MSTTEMPRMSDGLPWLIQNPYPGRGIVMGMDERGENLIQIYWLMGRSGGSRNRMLHFDQMGNVSTKLADRSKGGGDTSLTLYNAMEGFRDHHVVSNGNQTSDIAAGLRIGKSLRKTMEDWGFEPDSPHFTPRISGVCSPGASAMIELSVIRRGADGLPDRQYAVFRNCTPGVGYCVTTYSGDGDPLPSFSGDPVRMPLVGGSEQVVARYWDCLNMANKVAIVVKRIPMSGERISITIVNKYLAVY